MIWPFKRKPAPIVTKAEEEEVLELHAAQLKGQQLLDKFNQTIAELGVVADDKSDNS